MKYLIKLDEKDNVYIYIYIFNCVYVMLCITISNIEKIYKNL